MMGEQNARKQVQKRDVHVWRETIQRFCVRLNQTSRLKSRFSPHGTEESKHRAACAVNFGVGFVTPQVTNQFPWSRVCTQVSNSNMEDEGMKILELQKSEQIATDVLKHPQSSSSNRITRSITCVCWASHFGSAANRSLSKIVRWKNECVIPGTEAKHNYRTQSPAIAAQCETWLRIHTSFQQDMEERKAMESSFIRRQVHTKNGPKIIDSHKWNHAYQQ